MARILARSPHIIEIDETGVTGSKIELFIYSQGSSVPSTPTYTLDKLIPASNNLKMYYDISPYLREFMSFNTRQSVIGSAVDSGVTLNTHGQVCNVDVKRYKQTAGGVYTLLDTTTHYVWDGYGYYEEGSNPTVSGIYFSLDEGTYHYKYSSTSDPVNNVEDRAGILGVWDGGVGTDIKYTNLVTGASHTVTAPFTISSRLYDVPLVWYDYYSAGNKVEFINSGITLQEYIIKPKDECRYTPVMIDFVNKKGYWQREFLFKASKKKLNVSDSSYNLMQSSSFSYNTIEGQRGLFNINGQESINCNSGYVTEDYFDTIKQMMLSEKLLVDSKPAQVNTKSLEQQKNINGDKLISYELEFIFSFDTINSVI